MQPWQTQPPAVHGVGWLATVGGALATILPVVGWLSGIGGFFLAASRSSGPATNGALSVSVLLWLGLGGLAVIAWIAGIVGWILGLTRGRAGSRGRALVFVGMALSGVAVVSWIVEWVALFSAFSGYRPA